MKHNKLFIKNLQNIYKSHRVEATQIKACWRRNSEKQEVSPDTATVDMSDNKR